MQKFSHISLIWVVIIALMTCAFAAQAVIQPDEVVLYWTFEDISDEAMDVSGREHHGVITDGEYVEGKKGLGLEFNGTSTFIELAHHDDFDLPNSYTLAVWAMINDIPQDHIGIPRKEGSYILHPSRVGDGYNFHTYVYTPGTIKLVHGDVVDFGDWHHLAGTYDGSRARSWLDGQVIVEQPVAGEVASTPDVPLRWANDCCGGRMLNGILDEIVIINRALDEAEMTSLMEDGALAAVSASGKLATQWSFLKSHLKSQ